MFHIKDLSKFYFSKGTKIQVLDKINLKIAEGEFLKITGPNGSENYAPKTYKRHNTARSRRDKIQKQYF